MRLKIEKARHEFLIKMFLEAITSSLATIKKPDRNPNSRFESIHRLVSPKSRIWGWESSWPMHRPTLDEYSKIGEILKILKHGFQVF